jgi:hypothetical protein
MRHKNKPCAEGEGQQKEYQLYRTGHVKHHATNLPFSSIFISGLKISLGEPPEPYLIHCFH